MSGRRSTPAGERRAYALRHPVYDGRVLVGHRKRVGRRYSTELWCDGERWHLRVDLVGNNFAPQPLCHAPPGAAARMRRIAAEMLAELGCGAGATSVTQSSLTMEAVREMTVDERRVVEMSGAAA